eukprot:TRINITY_DN7844_c0_g4_i1.p1 TRINITY_DN7844_c0_g4~~TRINITY_DN7844_c0_g4_i1.p1  ORF type:complete len:141 (-),score=20.95 TRINITY_DN7844_c0_g4_i1:66-488(-)
MKRCISRGFNFKGNNPAKLIRWNSTVSFISKDALSLYTKAASDIKPSLYQNIHFNPNPDSGLKHIEVTSEHIRLEFNQATDEYKQYARLMDNFTEDADTSADKRQIPDCFVPEDVQNRLYCGAGATVVLNKRKIAKYLNS